MDLKQNILQLFKLSDFDLIESDVELLKDHVVVIKKWNWSYAKAHLFQLKCIQFLQDFPQSKILIACNHPAVLTNGRGLQKPKKGQNFELKEFKQEDYPNLPLPLYQIERGGGLTFHHPGQYIIYPILKLNPKELSLSNIIDQLLSISEAVLAEWGVTNLNHENALLGLWRGSQKIASVGIAINKFTTFHGMAINFSLGQSIQDSLKTLNPCGLNSSTYAAVENFIALPPNHLEKFHQDFIKRLTHAW